MVLLCWFQLFSYYGREISCHCNWWFNCYDYRIITIIHVGTSTFIPPAPMLAILPKYILSWRHNVFFRGCCLGLGVFLRWVREYACSSLCSLGSPGVETAQSLCSSSVYPHYVCDVTFEYASTKQVGRQVGGVVWDVSAKAGRQKG